MVDKGSVEKTAGTLDINFLVTDFKHTVPVRYSGILPDLFREGQGVVAHGRLQDGTFVADEILAKHDEKYMPPEVARIAQGQSAAAGPARRRHLMIPELGHFALILALVLRARRRSSASPAPRAAMRAGRPWCARRSPDSSCWSAPPSARWCTPS